MAKTLDEVIDQLIAARTEVQARGRLWSPPVWIEDESGYREVADIHIGANSSDVYMEVGRRDLRTKR